MSALLAGAGGALAMFLSTTAPHGAMAWLFASAGLAALLWRPWRLLGAFLLGSAWTAHAISVQLDDRLAATLDGVETQVTGVVAGLVTARGSDSEFLFRPVAGPGPELPKLLKVRWYRDAPELRPGEKWRLELRLRPPRSRVNFSGPDLERWYFAEGIGALASVTGTGGRQVAAGGVSVEGFRQRLREWIAGALEGRPARGLILALALADRSLIDPGHRQALGATGTGHLLAISGLHIGLAALFGLWLGRLACFLLPLPLGLRLGLRAPWMAGLAAALTYAVLAGFGTSTRRAVVMLTVLCFCRLSRRNPHPASALGVALAAVLLADPLAPLRAGFWLSFGAVAVLLALFSSRRVPPGRLRSLCIAQAGISLAMLPLGLYWFQQGTLLGLVANLAAIPWVSFLVVPPVLAGLGAHIAGLPGERLLELASAAAALLIHVLTWLADSFPAAAFGAARPAKAAVMLACGGAALLLLPRGIRTRWLAPFLFAPLLVPSAAEIPRGAAELELLDVGQGLAALVRTREHALLYDSGPGQPGEWDLAASVLRPAMSARAGRPDRIVISHGDLDHAGGLDSLAAWYPRSTVTANLDERHLVCNTGLAWTWDGVGFRVLHPGPRLPYLGNASSCVVSVATRRGAMLLPGDIDAAAEARLVRNGIGRHAVVVAPHHGSRTSSSAALVERLDPALALFATGPGNRFGFPVPEVVQRYRDAGAVSLATADCGALRVRLDRSGSPRVASARRQRPAPWRWPPADRCP